MKRKEALALIAARSGYNGLPSGSMDETDLLILSSIEPEKPKRKRKRRLRCLFNRAISSDDGDAE